MDRYLLNDILEYRDYSIWRDKIDEVNKEYHDKVYYDEEWKCLICKRSHMGIWNWSGGRGWRHYGKYIYHSCFKNNGREWTYSNVKLPKNY